MIKIGWQKKQRNEQSYKSATIHLRHCWVERKSKLIWKKKVRQKSIGPTKGKPSQGKADVKRNVKIYLTRLREFLKHSQPLSKLLTKSSSQSDFTKPKQW